MVRKMVEREQLENQYEELSPQANQILELKNALAFNLINPEKVAAQLEQLDEVDG